MAASEASRRVGFSSCTLKLSNCQAPDNGSDGHSPSCRGLPSAALLLLPGSCQPGESLWARLAPVAKAAQVATDPESIRKAVEASDAG